MNEDRQYRIRHRGYELWEAAGKPDGKHFFFWQAAERELMSDGTEDGGAGADEVTKPAGAKVHEAASDLQEGLEETFPASDVPSATRRG